MVAQAGMTLYSFLKEYDLPCRHIVNLVSLLYFCSFRAVFINSMRV